MKYAVLGDIHGNLTALETVLTAIERERVDRILSVGDVVGYGAAPSECIAKLRELGAFVVMGNHDAAAVDRLDTAFFNHHAKEAIRWTRGALSRKDKAWLGELPYVQHLEHCSVAHGTLHRPELFDYIMTVEDADPSFDAMTLPVCFVGHSHVPVTLLRLHDNPGRTSFTPDTAVDLADAAKALVNVGSVGQPRDEDPRTGFAIYDSAAESVELKRLAYDIDREAHRIRAAGLPQMLADRLYLGV
ncbi:MAG: metallophosphoesterase family protein [Planctomycetaceae bacterium]|jgi:diadenosine tetraphosphatase ApaH/serine/threonine PP2A family protein phosphatase|nr:metallophosphoesterase family protein [Planctomycetaceae bacterium]